MEREGRESVGGEDADRSRIYSRGRELGVQGGAKRNRQHGPRGAEAFSLSNFYT